MYISVTKLEATAFNISDLLWSNVLMVIFTQLWAYHYIDSPKNWLNYTNNTIKMCRLHVIYTCKRFENVKSKISIFYCKYVYFI